MQHIASLSYGKDSIFMLEVIKQNNLPLDRIIHVEVMATPTISADLPEMADFKDYADSEILKRYGIKVERFKANLSYEEQFYKIRGKKALPKNQGKIYGFPMRQAPWCNSFLKRDVFNKIFKKDDIQYIGIAFDEPKRFKVLSELKISPLVEFELTEQHAFNWCKDNNLLAPIYAKFKRDGCWFCHNQTIDKLRYLYSEYPHLWGLLAKWDRDSPVQFTQRYSVAELQKRFKNEDKQQNLDF